LTRSGTAIALRLGHRASVDFDFFSDQPLDRRTIQSAFEFDPQSVVLQDQPDTLTLLVPADGGHVKVSFFGGVGFGRVGEPDLTDDGVLLVASLADLMATMVNVVLQRVEAKDYLDVAAMVAAGVSLASGLSAAREMYGPSFQPSECLKALTYFKGGDLDTLTTRDKSVLATAVHAIRNLPRTAIRSKQLSAIADHDDDGLRSRFVPSG
jgi:hypothetical protein